MVSPRSSTTTRGWRSSSGPKALPSTVVRWFRRSSLRQSAAEYQLPRSSSTTLRPAVASSLATTPPPAPAPTMSAFTCFRAMDSSHLWLVVVLTAADGRERHADHFPAHPVAIAAMARVAIEALAGVGQNQFEKRGGAFLDISEHFSLLPGGQFHETPAEFLTAGGIHGGDALAIRLPISLEGPGELDIDVVDCRRLFRAGVAIGRDNSLTDGIHGLAFFGGEEEPGAGAVRRAARNSRSGNRRRKACVEKLSSRVRHGIPFVRNARECGERSRRSRGPRP